LHLILDNASEGKRGWKYNLPMRMPFSANQKKGGFFIKKKIGCRFSLYPMSDNYATIILHALEKTDTSMVQKQTDIMSTYYSGQQNHVVDCTKAVFTYAWKENIHMAGEFTFSNKIEDTKDAVQNSKCLNTATAPLANFTAYAKICTLGENHTENIAELAEKHGLQHKTLPLITMLKGSANSLFDFLNDVLTSVGDTPYVLQTTVSVNSPTESKW